MEHLAPTNSSPSTATLALLGRQIRSTILAADHVSAGLLVNEYAHALAGLWESMPDDERAISELPQVSLDLLEWARQAALIHRALTTEQLDVLKKASQYHTATVGISTLKRRF